MEQWHYNEIKREKKFLKQKRFVLSLHKAGIPISNINTNDWETNLRPGVYIGKRIYRRFSKIDLKNAIKHYKSLKKH